MVIKTGCSASLVALHEACRALQNGDCTSAIVAGTNLIMGPTTTAAMTQEGILSAEASCKTFDSAADGFARAEAITAIYIKPLDRALKDGNPVRAIVRNTGTNSDGKSASLMSPNGRSHELLMRKVYEGAGLDPEETAFVEVRFSTVLKLNHWLSLILITSATARVLLREIQSKQRLLETFLAGRVSILDPSVALLKDE